MSDGPSATQARQLVCIELNEFDPDYLREVAATLGLKNMQAFLRFSHAATTTQDQVEHQGLDPWVQWVGVHCGQPSDVHNVRRLGATRQQTLPQVWHAVADLGYTWGVWGAMNAPLQDRAGCKFFMPDPWSFDEVAFPENLNDLLALPRYTAKNYLDLELTRALPAALRLARFFAPPTHWAILARLSHRAITSVTKAGLNVHTFTTLLDYLSVLCFVRLRKKLRPDFSLIFLNHIAHLQHQFWTPGSVPHPEMKLGLELSNAMFGLLLADRRHSEALLVMNGLKQRNVAGQGFYVYRQRNPSEAVRALGVSRARVEQNMTNDANILFESKQDAEDAFAQLDGCVLSDGHKAFYVERAGERRVFYQCSLEHKIAPDTRILGGSVSIPFFEIFEVVTERTGAHVPEGDVFFDGIDLPSSLFNHELYAHIVRYFACVVSSVVDHGSRVAAE